MSGMLCFYITKPVIYTLWSRHNERRGQRDSIELSALICSFMKMFGETLYSESLIFVFFGVFLWTYVDDNLRSHGGSLLYQDDCVAPRHWSWVSFVFPSLFIRLGFGEGKQILDLYPCFFFLSLDSWTAPCLECESAVASIVKEVFQKATYGSSSSGKISCSTEFTF